MKLNIHEIQAGWRELREVGKDRGSEAWNQNILCISSAFVPGIEM